MTKNASAAVTILTVKHGALPPLTLAFAARDQALSAIPLHLGNDDEETTITVRTLRVISGR